MERLTEREKGMIDVYLTKKKCTVLCGSDEYYEEISKLADYEELEEQGLLVKLPCNVGDIIYRICPKCNDKHNCSCENCAWRGSLSNHGCDVYGLWRDGQFPASECHVVPYKVSWNYIPNLLEHFGKTVFLTKEEAEKEMKRLAG